MKKSIKAMDSEIRYFIIPKSDYTIREKINTKKSLKEIFGNNVPNYKYPKKEEFIKYQILIDYIIAEKYKGREISLDNIDNFPNIKKVGGGKELLTHYIKMGAKIYYDESIDADTYYSIQKYYYNENAFKKKLRIRLNIDNNLLKDEKKVILIVNEFINKISDITKISTDELFVTNVRKNCLSFDIFHLNEGNVSDIDENLIINNLDNLNEFNRRLLSELGIENPNQNRQMMEINVTNVINNFIMSVKLSFYPKYNKEIGTFGRILIFFNRTQVTKNGRTYYYPNQRWEGFGLRIPLWQINNETFFPDNIFDDKSDWCICYADLHFTKLSYKIENIKRETFYNNESNKYSRYSLLYQCKIKRSEIASENNDFITLRDNNYKIPYRLLKENIDNK